MDGHASSCGEGRLDLDRIVKGARKVHSLEGLL